MDENVVAATIRRYLSKCTDPEQYKLVISIAYDLADNAVPVDKTDFLVKCVFGVSPKAPPALAVAWDYGYRKGLSDGKLDGQGELEELSSNPYDGVPD
jgi:hypothetical protein